jgi:hypothetical protein
MLLNYTVPMLRRVYIRDPECIKGGESHYRRFQVHGSVDELIGDIDFEYRILTGKVSEPRH